MGKTLTYGMAIPCIDSMEITCYCGAMERYAKIVKAWPPEKLMRGVSSVSITEHAIARCQQRVTGSLTRDETRGLLSMMVSLGRTRATPRKWTKQTVSPAPGLRFLYWSELPDVCGLILGRTLVTVLTQDKRTPSRVGGRRRSLPGLHRRKRRHSDGEQSLSSPFEDTHETTA